MNETLMWKKIIYEKLSIHLKQMKLMLHVFEYKSSIKNES